MTCPNCDGDKWFVCRTCSGTGGGLYVCQACCGKGQERCERCGGTGTVEGDDREAEVRAAA